MLGKLPLKFLILDYLYNLFKFIFVVDTGKQIISMIKINLMNELIFYNRTSFFEVKIITHLVHTLFVIWLMYFGPNIT